MTDKYYKPRADKRLFYSLQKKEEIDGSKYDDFADKAIKNASKISDKVINHKYLRLNLGAAQLYDKIERKQKKLEEICDGVVKNRKHSTLL